MALSFDWTVKRCSFTREIREDNPKAKFGKIQGPLSKENSKELEPMGYEYAEVIFREWYYSWWKGLIILPVGIWWYYKLKRARAAIKSYLSAGWKPQDEMYVQQIIVQYCGLPWEWTPDFVEVACDDFKEMKKLFKKVRKDKLEDYEMPHAKKQLREFFEENKANMKQKNVTKIEKGFEEYGI